MNERKTGKLSADGKSFDKRVGKRELRRIRARKSGNTSIWEGLGMFGMIGWSVAIPTLAGVAAGMWLDSHYPSTHSWTLSLIITGVVAGCLNAWRWIAEENRNINKKNGDQ